MYLQKQPDLADKLAILADAAKYDVACTSSGAQRNGRSGALGNAVASGICHSFSADGRCISLLKILMTNHCVYDCKYCINRRSNDVPRAFFTPEEICSLTMEFYRRNYIEGLFLSSGVLKSPAYTMEKMCQVLQQLRTEYHFNGYIHVKVIPGAPDELLARAGYLADRVSVNLELPTVEGMKTLAPNKTHSAILRPMGMMANTIAVHRQAQGKSLRMERSGGNRYLENSIFHEENLQTADRTGEIPGMTGERELSGQPDTARQSGSPQRSEISQHSGSSQRLETARQSGSSQRPDYVEGAVGFTVPEITAQRQSYELPADIRRGDLHRAFASAGQSTQMVIGATPETDHQLLRMTQALYRTYDLKRVFFSAYIPLNDDSALPAIGTPPPLLREHRLYQADWLLRFYGFQAEELLSPERPNFNEQLDPKCDWALRHLELFPVEVNTAPYAEILRIPGVGPKSAQRIVRGRRQGSLDFQALKKMGVVLKRARYFITCSGRMLNRIPIDERFITNALTDSNRRENWEIAHPTDYYQMSLFSDFGLQPAERGRT